MNARRRMAALGLAVALSSFGMSSAYAQATWVGGTSQDFNTGANWSVNPPSGAVTVNTATAGVFPIFTGSQAFTVTDIIVGSTAGQTGRLDVNSGTLATGAANWLQIGATGGTGTVNIANGATVTTAQLSMTRGTAATANATLNVAGTLSTTGQVRVADGQNNATACVATLNVTNGGVVNCENDLIVAFAGNASGVGTVNIEAGAVVNVASSTERWVIINQWDPLHGHLNVNGGTLNLHANTDIRFNTGNANTIGSSSLSLNGGAIVGGATSVISLNQSANNAAVSNTFNLNGGTLTIAQIISGQNVGTRVINFNGSTVRASAATADFIPATAASIANVKAGGAIFDSNGFDITVAETLVADTVSLGGGLTKLGTGTLTLTAANTYHGDTTVSEGTLVIADNASLKFIIAASGVNNKITGTGAVTLNGDFDLDLVGASRVVGSSWQLVDVATLTETYGPTFSVVGFALAEAKWLKLVDGAFYQFDPATGILSVVNNPSVPAPTVTPGGSRPSYATGSDIFFGVTASGAGTLSYQWYFQANGAPSPVLISGATSAGYTVTNAATGSEGVYSVVVTDSAANDTTTVSFPTFSLVPGTDFTVAYYRFEDGTTGSPISPANDSIGTNPLTPLGTPSYASESLPYTTIPRTGAANTMAASFPATDPQGLEAPTSGTLAEAPFLDFTIEAFVRFDSVAGTQTIVGRDDSGAPGQGAGSQALFYLSKSGTGFRAELIDKSGANIQINSTSVPTVGTWYHLAAVGDATKGTFTLYVNGASVGSATGFTGLLVPTVGSDTSWTVGRGDWNFGNADYFRGDLDEVRFSSAALPPAQFLNSAGGIVIASPTVSVSPAAQTVGVGSTVTLTATGTSNMGGTVSFQWYKDGGILSGQTASTLVFTADSLSTAGSYSVVATDSKSVEVGVDVTSEAFTTLRVIQLPAAGRRSIGLNFVGSGTGDWGSSPLISSIAADYVAGVYPAINWNNSAAVTNVSSQATPLSLAESNGGVGHTTATWTSANTWSARVEFGAPEIKSEHGRLIHGYIESRAATGASITLNNIPYASYDVFVYVSGGNGGTNVGSVSLDRVGTQTQYFRVVQNDGARPVVAPTAEAPYAPPAMIGDAPNRDAALLAPLATFTHFTGITGSDLTISYIDSVLNSNSGGIAAIQIVDTTPAGTAYPPSVTTTPVSQLKAGGASATFSVAAVSNNAGGVISYQWQKDTVNLVGETGASLMLANVDGADTGTYSVVVTDTSSLGVITTTSSASLIVVDGTRPLLINGDLNAAASSTFVGNGILRTTGSDTSDLGVGTTVWNGVLGAAGTATRTLAKESTGLTLPGVSFTFGGADGVEDNTAAGFIAGTAAEALSRDYLYTDNQATPLTGSIGGLDALVGHQVTLVVYAYGKLSTAFSESVTSDQATVTLATANNHLGTAPYQTKTSDFAGRNVVDNNLTATAGVSAAYATFTGVVAPGGTISWSLSPDVDSGRIPLVGFQLLVSGTSLAPAVPTGLAAVAGNAQVALTWNASSGANTYTIGRSTVSGGPYTTISAGAVATTNYTDTTVANGTTYYYVVAAAQTSPAIQSANSAQVSATPANSATGLQNWRQANFGSTANTGNGANTADPDGDGLVNLLEYALGTNPMSAAASPVVLGQSGGALTLGFSPVVDANLTYAIEASNDLAGAWSVVHTYPAFASTAPVTYTDAVLISANPRRFLRLKVTSTE